MNILTEFPFVENIKFFGGATYLVGGYVRDLLLGRESKDIDLLVTGIPIDKIINILENYGKVDQVGKSFGVLKMRYKEYDLDIALPRTEIKTGEGHTGFEIVSDHNIPLIKDLERRDFTMNAIALDEYNRYIDPFGGIKDIVSKTIKAVSLDTFSDDPLRILRSFQFSSRLDFSISSGTLSQIYKHKESLSQISGERIRVELQKLVKGDKRDKVLRQMYTFGIIDKILAPYHFNSDFHAITPNMIGSIASLVFTLCGFEYDEIISRKLKLSNEEERELQVLSLVYHNPFKTTIFHAAKKWKGIYATNFFERGKAKYAILEMNKGYFPKDQSEIDITSEQLMTQGYTGKQLGEAWYEIVSAIMLEKINNDEEEIIAYLKNNL